MHPDDIESERLGREQPASSSADRYQVVVHVPAEALRKVPAGTSAGNDGSHLEHGLHVPAETARRLACDGAIVPLLEDIDGQPLSIGRKSRSIPPALRRALLARDQGCRFPGCINRHHLDGHHVTGPMAARPAWTTRCCCAGIITDCITRAAAASSDRRTVFHIP